MRPEAPARGTTRIPASRHPGIPAGMSMYLLADGHVKFLGVESVAANWAPVSNTALGNLAATFALW